MKTKLLTLSLISLFSLTSQAQTVLFEDDFESYTNFAQSGVGNWTIRDIDQAPTYGIENEFEESVTFPGVGQTMGFFVFNPSATTPALYTGTANGYEARSGNKYMAAIAAAGAVNNDWLISPSISLGSSGNNVSFYAKSLTTNYNGGERFAVYVSTTDTQVASFTKISANNFIVPPTSWTEYTYDLSAYNNQNVYIAIRCVSDDEFIFMVDDFKVTSTITASTQDFANLGLSMYPNPVNDVLNISSNNGLNIQNITITDINGRTVKQTTTSQINVSDLASGTYIIKVQADKGTATSKFIKK